MIERIEAKYGGIKIVSLSFASLRPEKVSYIYASDSLKLWDPNANLHARIQY